MSRVDAAELPIKRQGVACLTVSGTFGEVGAIKPAVSLLATIPLPSSGRIIAPHEVPVESADPHGGRRRLPKLAGPARSRPGINDPELNRHYTELGGDRIS